MTQHGPGQKQVSFNAWLYPQQDPEVSANVCDDTN